MWGSEFHGKATSFTSPYQPEHRPWSLSSNLLGTAQEDGWREGPLLQPNCCGGWVANPLDLVLTPPSVCCKFLLNFVVSLVWTGVECSWGCSVEWLDPLNVDGELIPAVWLLKNQLQEEDEAHLVGELWLMSSGTVSRARPSGAVPQADGGGSDQAPGGGGWGPLWSESSGLRPVGQ